MKLAWFFVPLIKKKCFLFAVNWILTDQRKDHIETYSIRSTISWAQMTLMNIVRG